jgi:hypothetical protein
MRVIVFKQFTSGTPKERGLIHLYEAEDATGDDKRSSTYEIPILLECLRKQAWFRYIPVCPTYRGLQSKCRQRQDKECAKKDKENAENFVTYL